MIHRLTRLPFTGFAIWLIAVFVWLAAPVPQPLRAYAQNSFVAVSAASYAPLLAPESIAAGFGVNMATGVFVARTLPLPTELGGTIVRVNDVAAPLFFVSPTQINFAIPAGTALGTATLRVTTSNGTMLNGTIEVTNTAPAIFTANATGRGMPAAVLLRLKANGEQLYENVNQTINLPAGERVFLILFACGTRRVPSAIAASVGDVNLTPAYVGEAPGFAALDQLNIELSHALAGRGLLKLRLLGPSGQTSNDVDLLFTGPTPTPTVTPTPSVVGTYYVSPSGSDGGSGAANQPFRTLQKAADVVKPGETVIVEDGVYNEPSPNIYCETYTAVLCLVNGGTADKPITFKARNKWRAKIDGQNGRVQNGIRFASSSANYIRIEGFEIYGAAYAEGSATGIELYSGGIGAQIVNNNIHDIGRVCTGTENGLVGIFLSQNNVVIENNWIHDIGRFAEGENGCRPGNEYWKNHDHGIYHHRGDNATIRNNLFSGFQRGWAIQAYPHPRTRTLIAHNTFSGANPYNAGHIIIYRNVGMSDSVIANNIFHEPKSAAIYLDATIRNVTVANNLTTASKMSELAPPAEFRMSNNLLAADPRLMNASTFDFRLSAASPAIDKGMILSEVPVDIEGRSRNHGTGPDIGAYEYSGNQAVTIPFELYGMPPNELSRAVRQWVAQEPFTLIIFWLCSL